MSQGNQAQENMVGASRVKLAKLLLLLFFTLCA